jgi:hypothetical protein
MNPLDDQLGRLLRAAASGATVPAPPAGGRAPDYGLDARVLAAWRDADAVNFWNPALLRCGLIVACVLMALSFWPLLKSDSTPESEYLQLADSAFQVNNTP